MPKTLRSRSDETALAELRKEGIDPHAVTLDVSDGDSVRQAAAHLGNEVVALDVLVNADFALGAAAPVSEEGHRTTCAPCSRYT